MNSQTTSDKNPTTRSESTSMTTTTKSNVETPFINNNATSSTNESSKSNDNDDDVKVERKYRRDFSKPVDLPRPGAETSTRKLSIEEEFDKFFSKYRRPTTLDRYKSPSAEKTRSSINLKSYSSELNGSGGGVGVTKKADDSDVSEKDDSLRGKPPRRSRFLRPDFYDTPPEESKYVIKNEKVRAFRERSLSRQRELSRNMSTESFALRTSPLHDYVRSKTCSLSDKLENAKKLDSYRRTISEDNSNSKFQLSRSSSRSDMETEFKMYPSSSSKRKSLILQNELENEMRKTKNMNSKLSGLMIALNDNENHYEKKLERLYGLKSKSDLAENITDQSTVEEVATIKADHSESNGVSETQTNGDKNSSLIDNKKHNFETKYTSKPDRLREFSNISNSTLDKVNLAESSGSKIQTGNVTKPNNVDNLAEKLSLLEKKVAYFKKLQSYSTEEKEKTEKDAAITRGTNCDLKASTSGTSTASFDNDTTSSLNTPPDDGDSDGCSVFSDGGNDLQYLESMNDRIRRRSFYSRFNIYKQKSTPNTQKTKPVAYSRSLSADYRQKPASSSKPAQ